MSDFDPNEVLEVLGDKKMKNFTEANYTISFINGSPGLVVRADEPAEVEERTNAILPYFRKFREAVEKSAATKSNAPKTQGMRVKCEVCGAEMEYKEGYSKKTKKNWAGYFCPNSTEENNHPPVWA